MEEKAKSREDKHRWHGLCTACEQTGQKRAGGSSKPDGSLFLHVLPFGFHVFSFIFPDFLQPFWDIVFCFRRLFGSKTECNEYNLIESFTFCIFL